MTAPFFPRRSVEDAAVDLIEAAARLHDSRSEADRVAIALEARWAANRAARKLTSEPSSGRTGVCSATENFARQQVDNSKR